MNAKSSVRCHGWNRNDDLDGKGLRRSLGAPQAKKSPATATIAECMTDAMPDDSPKGRRDPRHGHAWLRWRAEVVALNVEDPEFCDEGVR